MWWVMSAMWRQCAATPNSNTLAKNTKEKNRLEKADNHTTAHQLTVWHTASADWWDCWKSRRPMKSKRIPLTVCSTTKSAFPCICADLLNRWTLYWRETREHRTRHHPYKSISAVRFSKMRGGRVGIGLLDMLSTVRLESAPNVVSGKVLIRQLWMWSSLSLKVSLNKLAGSVVSSVFDSSLRKRT
jgi:hypothetical protein